MKKFIISSVLYILYIYAYIYIYIYISIKGQKQEFSAIFAFAFTHRYTGTNKPRLQIVVVDNSVEDKMGIEKIGESDINFWLHSLRPLFIFVTFFMNSFPLPQKRTF